MCTWFHNMLHPLIFVVSLLSSWFKTCSVLMPSPCFRRQHFLGHFKSRPGVLFWLKHVRFLCHCRVFVAQNFKSCQGMDREWNMFSSCAIPVFSSSRILGWFTTETCFIPMPSPCFCRQMMSILKWNQNIFCMVPVPVHDTLFSRFIVVQYKELFSSYHRILDSHIIFLS